MNTAFPVMRSSDAAGTLHEHRAGNDVSPSAGSLPMTKLPGTPVSRSTFLAAAAGLLLAACGADTSGATSARTDDRPIEPAVTNPAATNSQPDGAAGASVIPAALIGSNTIEGVPFDTAALAGRPTVVWFWAPWCVICRGEAPEVADVAARYVGRVNFVGVAGRGDVPEMRDFVSDTGTASITHLDDSSGEIWASYEIYAQPAYAFITDDGRLETYPGALGADSLAEIVDQLILA